MSKVKVKVLRPLYPYEKGEVAELRSDKAEMWVKRGYVELASGSKKVKDIPEQDVEVDVEEKAIDEAPADKSMAKKKKSAK